MFLHNVAVEADEDVKTLVAGQTFNKAETNIKFLITKFSRPLPLGSLITKNAEKSIKFESNTITARCPNDCRRTNSIDFVIFGCDLKVKS